MNRLTHIEQRNINIWFDTHPLTQGVGSLETACTITGINIALSGAVTDRRPTSMSTVMHSFAIQLHDALSAELLSGPEYREVAKRLADTGNDFEAPRLTLIINWMWQNVFPQFQALAADDGVGEQWKHMISERTATAAEAIAPITTMKGLKSPAVVARAAAQTARADDEVASADHVDEAQQVAAQIAGEALGTAAWAARDNSAAFWAAANPIALIWALVNIDQEENI